jgi:hypothetical protein
MKTTAKYLVLLLILLSMNLQLFAASKVRGYQPTTIDGHPVWVSEELIGKEPQLLKEVLATLRKDLEQLDCDMPAPAREAIRSTAIWLELETVAFGIVSGKGAVYHPSKSWLIEHGKEPAMVNGIQMCSAKNYLKWRNGKVGMTVLHELAHAYYHVLDGDKSQVKAAYKLAKRKGIYNNVSYMNSITKYKAYAMGNEHEYFAELSEAYFGCNDYFPYNRQQLKQHDPAGYEMVHKIWNLPANRMKKR